MPILYNCRHAGDQYRITKFDDAMNVESSYLTFDDECDCPAGERKTCRHREMLPKFIERGHIGDEWFFDFDRGGWVQMGSEWVDVEKQLDRAMGADADDQQSLQDSLRAQPDPSLEPLITERPKQVFIRRRI